MVIWVEIQMGWIKRPITLAAPKSFLSLVYLLLSSISLSSQKQRETKPSFSPNQIRRPPTFPCRPPPPAFGAGLLLSLLCRLSLSPDFSLSLTRSSVSPSPIFSLPVWRRRQRGGDEDGGRSGDGGGDPWWRRAGGSRPARTRRWPGFNGDTAATRSRDADDGDSPAAVLTR